MNTEVVVAIIGLLGVIISVFVTAKSTQDKMTHELQTQNAVQNQKIDQLATDIQTVKQELTDKIDANHTLTETKFAHMNESLDIMKTDIQEHNHYAKLFSESMPVVQERQTVANKRIDDLERDVRELTHKKEE